AGEDATGEPLQPSLRFDEYGSKVALHEPLEDRPHRTLPDLSMEKRLQGSRVVLWLRDRNLELLEGLGDGGDRSGDQGFSRQLQLASENSFLGEEFRRNPPAFQTGDKTLRFGGELAAAVFLHISPADHSESSYRPGAADPITPGRRLRSRRGAGAGGRGAGRPR